MKLKETDHLTLEEELDLNLLQSKIDSYMYMRKINNVLHESAVQSGCASSKVCKPKPYWCPKLSEIRDKKRFWWHMGRQWQTTSGCCI